MTLMTDGQFTCTCTMNNHLWITNITLSQILPVSSAETCTARSWDAIYAQIKQPTTAGLLSNAYHITAINLVSSNYLQSNTSIHILQKNGKWQQHSLNAMLNSFAMRCYAQAQPMPSCGICLHVHPSATFVYSVISSKFFTISSKFFHHQVVTPFYFFHTKRYGNIPMGTHLMKASTAGGAGKNRDSQLISGFIACCQWYDCQILCGQLCQTMASWWHSVLVSGIVCSQKFMTRQQNSINCM